MAGGLRFYKKAQLVYPRTINILVERFKDQRAHSVRIKVRTTTELSIVRRPEFLLFQNLFECVLGNLIVASLRPCVARARSVHPWPILQP